MLQYVYQKYDFQEVLKINPQVFQTMSLRMQQSYRDNPYHTSIHAADVLQNLYFYLYGGGVMDICKFTPIDLAGLFISSAAHDMDHPGSNNMFEIKTNSKLAILYND